MTCPDLGVHYRHQAVKAPDGHLLARSSAQEEPSSRRISPLASWRQTRPRVDSPASPLEVLEIHPPQLSPSRFTRPYYTLSHPALRRISSLRGAALRRPSPWFDALRSQWVALGCSGVLSRGRQRKMPFAIGCRRGCRCLDLWRQRKMPFAIPIPSAARASLPPG